MASPAQFQANRLNALRSTGPRTDEGKSASRFNALKHGIDARSLVIPGEDPNELDTLAAGYFEQFVPAGPLERFLVETIIQADWDCRRYSRIQAPVLQSLLGGAAATPGALVAALAERPAQFLFRRLAAAERSYFRALKELRREQRDRQAKESEAAPTPDAGIGFVPSPGVAVLPTAPKQPETPRTPLVYAPPLVAAGPSAPDASGGRL